MKAITQDRYGDLEVLEFNDIDQPVPTGDEVLGGCRRPGCIGVTGMS